MWSLFSRDPVKDFAFEIGEPFTESTDNSSWSLYQGKRKVDGEPVSVFSFQFKGKNAPDIEMAKAAYKRLRTLRHPNILKFIDGLESDSVIYIVTEEVTPLESTLSKKDFTSELSSSWGLHQISKAVSFLNNDCNLIHNTVNVSAVYVDKAGEWKLGSVDYMRAVDDNTSTTYQQPPSLQKYNPPEKQDSRFGKPEKWSTDAWGLGCLIWEIYNGQFSRIQQIKNPGKIPPSLQQPFIKLTTPNPSERLNPSKLLHICRQPGGFMNNSFIHTNLFLEELQIKEPNEKNKFFNQLPSVLDDFPADNCKHKILPLLLNAFEFGNAGSAVLPPLFKLGKLLDNADYERRIVPCLIKMFSSPDRSTRIKLLQQMELFVEHLDISTVNNQIFPHVSQGFMDTNPPIREQTVKAMILLAPKLNDKHLNYELMKHFARIQTKDTVDGIRTNTTICLGKIAGYLEPQIRQKVLLTAFTRAMRDRFPPSRCSGIMAMSATQQFYTLKECAGRIIPALSIATVDPEKQVRDQAFKAIAIYLSKLEKASKDPDCVAELEAGVNAPPEKSVVSGGSGVSSWAGWAMSSLSGWSGKTGKPPRDSKTNKVSAENTTTTTTTPAVSATTTTTMKSTSPIPQTDTTASSETDNDWGELDEWDDVGDGGSVGEEEWDDAPISQNPHMNRMFGTTRPVDRPVEEFVPDQSDLVPASTYNWGGGVQETKTVLKSEDNFFGELLPRQQPQKHKKKHLPKQPTIKSLAEEADRFSALPVHSGQTDPGDWGESEDWSFATEPISKGKKSNKPVNQPSNGKIESSQQVKANQWDTDDWSANDDWTDAMTNSDLTTADSGWSEDTWEPINSGFNVNKDEDVDKKRRQERRQQRQQELEQKRALRQTGAMKLGSRKLATD